MPLLSEQIRDPSTEACLIDDMATYTINSATWATVKNYGNIVLAADSLVLFHYTVYGGNVGNSRLKIGTLYVTGGATASVGVTEERYGFCYLAAGTYQVVVEGVDYNAAALSISNFSLGSIVLPDFQAAALQIYSGMVTAPAVSSRKTLIGNLVNCILAIQAFATTSADVTNFENVGDNLTNGVSISVDGSQVNWSERNQDNSLAKGAAGAKCHYPVSIGSSHTVTISKRNANTVVHLSVVMCPWLCAGSIAQQYCPVYPFTFPQGTTLYVVLEPLSGLLLKGVAFGRKHATTLDTLDDYYASFSGSSGGTGGVVTGSYHFEKEDPAKQYFIVYGLSGFISIIAVDLR